MTNKNGRAGIYERHFAIYIQRSDSGCLTPSMKKAEVRRLKTEGAAISIQAVPPLDGQAARYFSILNVFSQQTVMNHPGWFTPIYENDMYRF
jgi:hypothetical protein